MENKTENAVGTLTKEAAEQRSKLGEWSGLIGLITNAVLFALKLIAGFASNSVAIMADAVNNLSDFATSLVVIVGFRFSKKPADDEHPYGHARMEYIAGVMVSFVIVFLGLQLGREAIVKIITPQPSHFTPLVLALMLISILIKCIQGLFYRRIAKRIDSVTIMAAAQDSRNDVFATSAILLGALISIFTGLNLDGYLGVVVAGFILLSGVKAIAATASPLLGVAPDEEIAKEIIDKILSYDGILGVHDLDLHCYGPMNRFATAHCEIPAEQPYLTIHETIDQIERDIWKEMHVHLVIHPDPVVQDERTEKMREEVSELLAGLYPEAVMHDFRIVWRKDGGKALFEMAVPFSEPQTNDRIRRKTHDALQKTYPNFRFLIGVDRKNQADMQLLKSYSR